MALGLEKIKSNGISLNYHRIVSLNIITNLTNIIEIASYISSEQREKEKEYYRNPTEEGMDVYIDTMYLHVPYDPEMTIETAYQFVEKTPYFEGAIFVGNKIDDDIIEIEKKDNEDLPLGDYSNPIIYMDGDEVEIGKWYCDLAVGKETPKECILSGVPTSFNDDKYLI